MQNWVLHQCWCVMVFMKLYCSNVCFDAIVKNRVVSFAIKVWERLASHVLWSVPWTPNLPASTFQELGLQNCKTMHSACDAGYATQDLVQVRGVRTPLTGLPSNLLKQLSGDWKGKRQWDSIHLFLYILSSTDICVFLKRNTVVTC